MPPKPRKSTPDKRKPTTGSGPSRNLLIALGLAAVVVAALVVGTIVLTGGNDGDGATSTGTNAALIAGIPQSGTILGNPDAKVTLLQYEDIQCPVCKTYTDDAFPTIVEEYVKPGKVKVDFRGLSFLGDDSVKALRIALAAAKQDKLWDVVEAFYANQGRENSGWVTDEKVNRILAQVPGLDAAKVLADAESAAVTAEIGKLNQEGSDRQVQGTPSFFIGIGADEPYAIQPTSLTPEAFRPALDDALQGR